MKGRENSFLYFRTNNGEFKGFIFLYRFIMVPLSEHVIGLRERKRQET